jgi:hypothetical protein
VFKRYKGLKATGHLAFGSGAGNAAFALGFLYGVNAAPTFGLDGIN